MRPSSSASSSGEQAVATSRERTPAVTASEHPWVWFVAKDRRDARDAALQWIRSRPTQPSVSVLSPPSSRALPVVLEDLETPNVDGELVVFAQDLECAFYDTPRAGFVSLASPLYLLPRLASKARFDAPIAFVVSSSEESLRSRGRDVLAQRGLASRFTFRHVAESDSSPSGDMEEEEDEDDIELDDVQSLLLSGLATEDPIARTKAYKQALGLAPDTALVLLFSASSLLERGDPKDAFRLLRRAVEIEPSLAPAHYELGKLALRSDDMESALEGFRKTTELVPLFSSAWGNLGAALGELQDLDGALSALTTAVTLDPLSHALHSNLGVLYRDRGDLGRAESECRRVIDLAPDFVFGHYNLAHVYFLQQRYVEAIETFELAQTMDRDRSARQALLLAATRLAAGDLDAALRDYDSVLDRLEGPMRKDMRTVAEWDLKQLAKRVGVSEDLKKAASHLRSVV